MIFADRVLIIRRYDHLRRVLLFLTVSTSGALLAGGCSADGKAFGGLDAGGGTGDGPGSGGSSVGGSSGGAGSGGVPATGGSRGEGGISGTGGRGEAGKGAGSGGHAGTGGSASGGGGAGGRMAQGGSPGTGGNGAGGAGGKSIGAGGGAGKQGAGGSGTAGAGGNGAGGQSGLTCDELVAEYAKAVPAARACSPGAANQCMQRATATLTYCTGCPSYVNDAKELTAIRAQWTAQGCAVPTVCPAIACVAVVETCVATDGGAPGGICQAGSIVAN